MNERGLGGGMGEVEEVWVAWGRERDLEGCGVGLREVNVKCE